MKRLNAVLTMLLATSLLFLSIAVVEFNRIIITLDSQPELISAEVQQVAKNVEPDIVQPEEVIIQQSPKTIVREEEVSRAASRVRTFKSTAYCKCTKCCGKWSDSPTKTGTTPKQGRTIAVDPKVIPLGSKVVIDGHTYIAEDTGSAIKGNKIDIYFDSHQEALKYGVKTVFVEFDN